VGLGDSRGESVPFLYPPQKGFRADCMHAQRENFAATEASIKVFRRYIRTASSPSETGSVLALDASGIISKDCFREWKESRSVVPAEPEKTFQRILTAHVTASDGRRFS